MIGAGRLRANTVTWALEADCVQCGEWKIGAPVTQGISDNIIVWAVIFIAGATLVGQILMWFHPLTEATYAAVVGDIKARRRSATVKSADAAAVPVGA